MDNPSADDIIRVERKKTSTLGERPRGKTTTRRKEK